jgi:hypothetical protein
LFLCLTNYALRYERVWGTGGIVPPFLTLALVVGDLSSSRPGRFTPGQIAPDTNDRDWVGPRTGLDAVGTDNILM